MNFYQAVEVKGGACLDCGYKTDLRGLQFDHRPGTTHCGKSFATLFLAAWAVIKREIDKCDLVCGTCHAIRTATRREVSYGSA
jgi:hypothetical protein